MKQAEITLSRQVNHSRIARNTIKAEPDRFQTISVNQHDWVGSSEWGAANAGKTQSVISLDSLRRRKGTKTKGDRHFLLLLTPFAFSDG